MAGELKFSLDMDEAKFIQSSLRSAAAIGQMGSVVGSTNQQMRGLARTAAGLVTPMSAVGYAAGPTAEFFIQGTQILPSLAQKFQNMTTPLAKQASALNGLASGTKSVTTSLKAMESLFVLFGGTAAPQMASGIMTVTMGMNALKATAIATGATLSTIGVAAVGVVGVFATLNAGIDALRANFKLLEAQASFKESLKSQRDKLLKMVQDLYAEGKIGKEEAINLQVSMVFQDHDLDELKRVLDGVRARIRSLTPARVDLDAASSFQVIEKQVAAGQLTGRARVQAELDIAVIQFTESVSDLGKAAGRSDKEVNDLINTFASGKLRELEQQFLPKDAKPASTRTGYDASLTNMERLGLVITSGVKSYGNDPQRTIVEHTRQMVAEQRKTNQALNAKTGTTVIRE